MSASDPVRPRSRWRRRLRKIGLWTAGVLGVLLVAARILACTPPGRALARRAIVSQLRQALHGEVNLARIDGDLLGTMHLRGISVRGPQGDIITIDDIEVKWSTWRAIKAALGTARFEAITVRGARVTVRQGADGQFELTTIAKPREASTGTTGIEQLAVRGAEIVYARQGAPEQRVRGLDLYAALEVGPRGLFFDDVVLGLAAGTSRIGGTAWMHQRADGLLDGQLGLSAEVRARDVRGFWPKSPLARDLLVRLAVGGPGLAPRAVRLEVAVAGSAGALRVDSRLPPTLAGPGQPLAAHLDILGLDVGALLGDPDLSELGRISGEADLAAGWPAPGAPLAELPVTLKMTLRGIRAHLLEITRIAIDAELRGKRAKLNELSVLARGAAARVSGEVDLATLDHRVHLLASVDDLGLVIPASVGLTGPAEVDAVIAGRRDRPSLRATVRGSGIAMHDLGLAARRLYADARLTGPSLDPLLEADVHLWDVDTPVRPVSEHTVRLRSYLARPLAMWSFDRIETRSGGRVVVKQRGEGSYSVGGAGMRADTLRLDLLSGRIALDANLDWKNRATARLSTSLDVAEILAFLPAGWTRGLALRSGHIKVTNLALSSDGSGRPAGLRVTGAAALEHGRLRGLASDLDVALRLSHDGRRRLDGEIGLGGRRWITLAGLTAPDRLLAGDVRVLQSRLNPGTLGGVITIEPGPVEALAVLAPGLAQPRLRAVTVSGKVELAVTAGAPELNLTLGAQGADIPGRPRFTAGVELHAPDYRREAGAPEPTEPVRRVACKLWVGPVGHRLAVDVSARASIADLLAYALRPRRDRLQRLLNAELAGGLRLDTVNLARLMRAAGETPPPWLAASVTGSLKLSGSARTPLLAGRISVGRLWPGLLGRLYVPVDIDLTPRIFAITTDAGGVFGWPFLGIYAKREGAPLFEALIDKKGPPIELSARLEQSRKGFLYAAAKLDPGKLGGGRPLGDALVIPAVVTVSQFDVEAVRGFVPSLRELAGTVNGYLYLDRLRPLAVSGKIEVKDGALALRGYPSRYDKIRVAIDLSGQDIVIREASLQATAGKLSLTGHVNRMREGEATILLSEFPLIGPAGPNAWVNGQLELSGAFEQGRLRGQARFVDAQLRLPPESTRDVQSLDPLDDVHVAGEPKAPPGILETMVAQLTLATERLWVVRGQDTRLAVAAHLEAVTKPGQPPQLAGQIRALAGDVEILGKAFRVQHGIITLDKNQKTIDPELDLRFAHSVQNTETVIYVDVSGRLSAPRIRFRSDPPMGEQEVLGLLLHGEAGWETNQAQSAARGRAERTIATIAQGFLRDRVPGARSLKFVAVIDPEEQRESGSTGGRYGITVPLTDNFLLETVVRTGTEDDENAVEGRAQYRLRRRLNIQVSAGNALKGGVDLIWTWRY